MRIEMNNISPNIRELPVSLKLNNQNKYTAPIKNDGYIINPKKYKDEIDDVDMDINELKALLLMMLKGDISLISKLIKTGDNKMVNMLV